MKTTQNPTKRLGSRTSDLPWLTVDVLMKTTCTFEGGIFFIPVFLEKLTTKSVI